MQISLTANRKFDIFWLKDESLEDSANLPAPDIIAAEIMEDLQANFETVCRDYERFGWRRETAGVSEPVKVDAS